MINTNNVINHYSREDLLRSISDGLEELGKSRETITVEDLAPIDEFHIGGSQATKSLLDKIGIESGDHVLDIGCGIGGASRFAAHAHDCRVTGIDLTDVFVKTGRALCGWVGLENRVNLVQGNALKMDFRADTFDNAIMLHVGMNIADKRSLAREAWRVLKPGGIFGIYDVMKIGTKEIVFPVPWATEAESSEVASPGEYKDALLDAGFIIETESNCRDLASAFFERLRSKAKATQGPSPLGLHILMGKDASLKVQNMIENIVNEIVAPVELIARKQS